MDEKLTTDERDFMRSIESGGRIPIPRSKLRMIATRAQDRARQSCKRKGYAEFVGGIIEGAYRPMGWRLTQKGRDRLATP